MSWERWPHASRLRRPRRFSQGSDERALLGLPRVVSLKLHELDFANFGNGDGSSSDMVLESLNHYSGLYLVTSEPVERTVDGMA